jgi:hypothetical protein
MRSKLGAALQVHSGEFVQLLDVIASMTALGAVGGLPVLANVLTKYARSGIRRLSQRHTAVQ